jgi:monoamine oxidase
MGARQIIVIGGGFAGVTAARDLTHLGYRVRLIEARDRLGGRTHRRAFAGADCEIETGGAWFMGERQYFTHREITRYGLSYKPDPPVHNYGHLIGGQRTEAPLPVPHGELLDLERGAFHILRAAAAIDPNVPFDLQPLREYDVTWDEFIAPAKLSPAARDLLDVWALNTVGGLGSEDGSAITILYYTALYGHSILNWHSMIAQQLNGGTRALLQAMIDDSAADVRLGTPVVRVEQDGSGVNVETADGGVFTAGGAVVALPVNCWSDVEFTPPLSDDKVQGSRLRPAVRGAKVWALVEDAPAGFLGYGAVEAGRGLSLVNGQGEFNGAQLVWGLSPIGKREGCDPVFDPLDASQIKDAIAAYMPGARVLATDAEDWNAPHSRGAWGSYRIGQMSHQAGMRTPEGRLAFATSDIARKWMSIDGAIESGARAADTLDRILSRDA